MRIICITENVFGVNSYCIAERNHVILVDPIATEDLEKIVSNHVVDFAILTHEHFDHIYSVNDLQVRYGIRFLCGKEAIEGLSNPSINMSRYVDYLSSVIPFGNHKAKVGEYTCAADGVLLDGESIQWMDHKLTIRYLPGHSKGSIGIVLDNYFLFSGDTIFKNYPSAVRLPGGSSKLFSMVTTPFLSSLQDSMIVYPGHGESFLLRERYNNEIM